jgi:outer membrane protein assembly factor BamB
MRLLIAAVAGGVALLVGCTSAGSPDPSATPPLTAPAAAATSTPTAIAPASADWPTYHGTPDRAGVARAMPAVLGTPEVRVAIRLDGAVYASPIVVGTRTIVATENDTVYALDSAYRQVWRQHLGAPSPGSERPCGNIDPLGITGTPTYDASTGLVYVAAEYGGPARHELVALDVRDGTVRWRRSIDLPGVQTEAMQQRGALAVAGGLVWVPFGGLAGDCGGYKGRLVGIRLDGSGAPVAFTVPTAREGGSWAPPGPAVDGSGRLYLSVGNGESGAGDRYDYSDSVLELDTAARLLDSFSPTTWASDNAGDLDLGSQGPALVGPWVFIAGKSGTAYVLRRDHLGGIGGEVSKGQICVSFGGTAVDGDVVYVPCTDGVRAVRIDAAGAMHPLWRVASGTVTGSPIVGGGRIWALDPSGGVLHALDPRTGASTGQVSVGATSRFATPAVTGGDLLVPTLVGLTVVRTS